MGAVAGVADARQVRVAPGMPPHQAHGALCGSVGAHAHQHGVRRLAPGANIQTERLRALTGLGLAPHVQKRMASSGSST
eukprot:12585730-Alexandrium_andersonii.AAC.1